MPGKQMAIDADLNAGLITRRRRKPGVKMSPARPISTANGRGIKICARGRHRRDDDSGINLIGGVCIGIFKYNLSADAPSSNMC